MNAIKAFYRWIKKWVRNGLEKPLLYILYFCGKKLGIWPDEPYYVVRIDGGISSQIDQYVIGLALFRAKGEKTKILYDLTWYKEYGMDLNNAFVRNFDLLRMYPDLEFVEVSPFLRRIYYNCFRYDGEWRSYKSIDVSQLPSAPLYLDGYGYTVSAQQLKQIYCTDAILHLRNPEQILSGESLAVYHQIMKMEKSIAVQVRRGDMAMAGFTSHPVSPQYYIEAMRMNCFQDGFFFFFSDEMQWVRDEIIPLLGENIQFQLVDINGSDRGYMDLFLCASCKHIISSQGSMGAKAAMLGGKTGSVLIMPEFRYDKRLVEAFSYIDIRTILTGE